MPHLTKRFTLLRAPDGTMVTPDAMRAHLRAQRARARAAGIAGNQNFLTEEEENEIIDQLRRQTRLEVPQEEEEEEELQASTRYGSGSDGFGGTDGFGGWGVPNQSRDNDRTESHISDSLAQSLSHLQRNDSNRTADSSHGGFFGARSSARDRDYMTEVQKGRAARGKRQEANGPRADAAGNNLDLVEEEETAEGAVEEDDAQSEEAMPGDFLAATKRASQRVPGDQGKVKEDGTLQIPASQQYRHSQLLTSLSPEAFKRVSTALEEVYGLVAGKVEEDVEVEDEDEEVVQDERSADSLGRPSIESDSHSYASAHSEVVAGIPHNITIDVTDSPPQNRDVDMENIGSNAMAPSDSSSTVQTITQLPYSSRGSADARSEMSTNQRPELNDSLWTRQESESGEKRTSASTSGSGYKPASSPRFKGSVISVDPANGRMRLGPSSPDANTFNLGESPLTRSIKSSSSPLQAGFNVGQGGAATATAAGVAAAAYVAQHQQQQQRQRQQMQQVASASPSGPVTSQIVMGNGSEVMSGVDTFRAPSSAASAVLSADAIAARSQRYFPNTSHQSLSKYADGFRTPVTPNSSGAGSQQSFPPSSTVHGARTAGSGPTSPFTPTSSSHSGSERIQNRFTADSGQTQDPNSSYGSNSFHEGDDEGSDDDGDVWAKVARSRAAQTQTGSRGKAPLVPAAPLNDPAISIEKLHENQDSLIRSASSHRAPSDAGKHAPSRSTDTAASSMSSPIAKQAATFAQASVQNPTVGQHLSTNSNDSMMQNYSAQERLEKARERARMLAEKQSFQGITAPVPSSPSGSLRREEKQEDRGRSISGASVQFPSTAAKVPPVLEIGRRDGSFDTPPSQVIRTSTLTSPRSTTRSQVMYDVTTSHRPTSPPPRSHKTSLSNLPSLQDLTMNSNLAVNQMGENGQRWSPSFYSMVDDTARMHEALTLQDGALPSPSYHPNQTREAITEEAVDPRESQIEYEEHHVEDGFGGYVVEHRPVIRSASHNLLSTSQHDPVASPLSPQSTHSEPVHQGEDRPQWSSLPQQEPSVTNGGNLADDVAAQAQAATFALKGANPERPRRLTTRTKSLSRGSKKKLSKTISQPQLLSTTQRLDHANELPKVDQTLARAEGNKHKGFSPSLMNQTSPMQQQQQTQNKMPMRPGALSRINTPTSAHTLRSPSSTGQSPTDYKVDGKTTTKASTPGHHRRSSSFGHQGRLEEALATPPASAPASALQHSNRSGTLGSPRSDRSTGVGLGRFMSRLRSKKAGDSPGASNEPYGLNSNPANSKSSPALTAYGTPSTSATMSPLFVTPGEEMHVASDNSGVANGGPRLPMPRSGATSLADLFGPNGQSPAMPVRTSSVRSGGQQTRQPPMNASLGSPAPIQEQWGGESQSGDNDQAISFGGVVDPTRSSLQADTSAVPDVQTKSARDTIVRRTIIVSVADPDDRRKSNVPTRKLSVRKPVPAVDVNDSTATDVANRSDSTTSNGAPRKSVKDRSTAMSGPHQSAASHDHKLSHVESEHPTPLPTLLNVSEMPSSATITSLAPPSPLLDGANRLSTAPSEYGGSLYDMYFDREDGEEGQRERGAAGRESRFLAPQASSTRQSVMEAGGNGNGARHIEVTERADGSVVWQVIAGLADRSSMYTNSMLYDSQNSRVQSVDSQMSLSYDPFSSPLSSRGGVSSSTSQAVANEDGRSLFARTKGERKSFSFDGEAVPPLPGTNTRPSGREGPDSTKSPPPPALEFDMATPAGAAATRIVYTSDADLANMLDSLAGPDKSSAKFEFQRLTDSDGVTRPISVVRDSRSSNDNNNMSHKTNNDNAHVNTTSGSDSNRSSSLNYRASASQHGSKSSTDIAPAESRERIRIEAEIYSLLQRDGHPNSVAATVARQHTDQLSWAPQQRSSTTTMRSSGLPI